LCTTIIVPEPAFPPEPPFRRTILRWWCRLRVLPTEPPPGRPGRSHRYPRRGAAGRAGQRPGADRYPLRHITTTLDDTGALTATWWQAVSIRAWMPRFGR